MENQYTYLDAFDALQKIVQEIEAGEVNVDELAEKIRKASQLISICKTKLTASEEEVDRLLAQLSQESKERVDTQSTSEEE